MNKKFVSLASDQSPSKNPYEVCTFQGESLKPLQPEWQSNVCTYTRDCNAPQNSTLAKVLTLQDEIRKLHERTQENLFLKPFCKRCKIEDRFTTCVIPQRTPEQLRTHRRVCEECYRIRQQFRERVHDFSEIYTEHDSLIKLKDPLGGDEEQDAEEDEERTRTQDDEGVKPEIASPECSREYIYLQPQNLLALHRPKSGLFVNETPRPAFYPSDDIPYSTYNPRLLQEEFDAQHLNKIDLIPSKNERDLWTWNIGLQKKESLLDREFIDNAVPQFECNDLELVLYRIPKDIEKTFSAGIVFGTKAVTPAPPPRKKPHYKRPTEMACLFIAFVEGFRLNADFWTAETLDNIIKMADKLIEKCAKLNYRSKEIDYDILPHIEERQASLSIKPHFKGPLKNEPNIYKALTIYFAKYNACILCSNKLFLLIWKRCKNFFYIYDPNGRSEKGGRDFEKGKSALMSTHFVEHLVHLIVNISQTNMTDEFSLYEIFLTSYGRLMESLPKKPFDKPYHKMWAVVNETYAVIPGCNNGIFQPTSAAMDNPSMLISVMAILYSHIERGNRWKQDQVDELIRLGTAYYKSLRRKLKLKDNQHVTIIDLPDKYVLGYFKASMKKSPFMYTGTVTDYCKKFKDSLITTGMQDVFNNKWEAALMQIDNSVVGIWRDGELFYVYDPFRRGNVGQVLDPDDYRTQGAAILQMHTNFDSLMKIIYEKALKMRRGGKFFIHAINVGCIKPIMDGKTRKLRYPKLKLTPETYVEPKQDQGQGDNKEGAEQTDKEENAKGKSKKDKGKGKGKDKKGKKSKDKDKKPKVDKVCSIVTLNEKDREQIITNAEIVEPLIEDLVCEIVAKFPETYIGRPKLYKSAGRVLLRTDKEYLDHLKYLVKHDEDYDNLEMSLQTEPDPPTPFITLDEELQLPSNFQNLPDNTWIIFGSTLLPHLDEEQQKLKGLLSAVLCAALSSRYKISTWSFKLIDFALDAADEFGENFQTYQYALGTLLNGKIPKIQLGERTFEILVQKILKSEMQKSLRQVLIENLIDYNRLVVICQRFSCLIVKRYNFLYMFSGFPVNPVGYRKYSTGPGSLMRFIELDSLIRRIEFGCNPHGCDIINYVVIPVKVVDITEEPMGRYRTWPTTVQKKMYNIAMEEKERREESKKSKLHFLNDELTRESRRVKSFLQEREDRLERKRSKQEQKKQKQQQKKKKPALKGKSSEVSGTAEGEATGEMEAEDYDFEQPEEEEESECQVKLKHDFQDDGSPMDRTEMERPHPVVYGYRLREKDLLFKIQGSKALEGRTEAYYDQIKPCLFASALAILYATLKPLNQWTSHRVDQVINLTLTLSEVIKDMSNAQERIFRNISVDDYIFDIWLRVYEPLGLVGNLNHQIEKILSQNKYIIFQTANCAYAMHKDKFYHLFDAYPSMELTNKEEEEEDLGEEEEEHKKHKKYPKTIKKYGERNTASWILFADVKTMINYLNQRASKKTWKEDWEYKFIKMQVVSFKKAPQSAFVLQLLTGLQGCNIQDQREASICAHNEIVDWLEHCLPIWSRLNRRNAAGRYRGMSVSKLKKYDVEINDRLWSLWGTIHPQAPVFKSEARGKQYLACCVIALCAACLYRLVDWNPQLLDSIIINGDRYFQQSMENVKCPDYQFYLEDLDVECMLDNVAFQVHMEMVAYGILYSRPYYNRMNLAEGLMYFFRYFQFGILQCFKKCLAIGFMPGQDGGYFMFDCQSREHPLFPKGQGASYILRTKYLQILLYCIVVTLNIPYYNVKFTLHKVNLTVKDDEDDH